MGLCAFRHIFGKERQGAHALRLPVLDLAAVDVALTALAALAIAKAGGWSYWLVLALLLLAGIALHRIFCVNTTLNMWIFGRV